MAKADKATKRKRVLEVMDLLVAGVESREIVQYAAKNEWNISEQMVRRYIREAYKELSVAQDHDAAALRARHLAQRRNLYRKAIQPFKDADGKIVSGPDLRAALQVLKDEAELQGLYPPKKIAPVSPDGTKQFDGGLAEILPELRAAVDRLRQGTSGETGGGDTAEPAV